MDLVPIKPAAQDKAQSSSAASDPLNAPSAPSRKKTGDRGEGTGVSSNLLGAIRLLHRAHCRGRNDKFNKRHCRALSFDLRDILGKSFSKRTSFAEDGRFAKGGSFWTYDLANGAVFFVQGSKACFRGLLGEVTMLVSLGC